MNLQRLAGIFGGRTTTFAYVCFVAGVGLAIAGRLTTDYVWLTASLAGIMAGRAIGGDKYQPPTPVAPENNVKG